jgi:hypothetical protein
MPNPLCKRRRRDTAPVTPAFSLQRISWLPRRIIVSKGLDVRLHSLVNQNASHDGKHSQLLINGSDNLTNIAISISVRLFLQIRLESARTQALGRIVGTRFESWKRLDRHETEQRRGYQWFERPTLDLAGRGRKSRGC